MSYPLYFVADFEALDSLTLNVKLFGGVAASNQVGDTIADGGNL